MERIDFVLVNPSDKKLMYGNIDTSISGIEPPLWTGLIASYVRRHGFSVRIIDADAENLDIQKTAEKILEYNPVLVAVGAVGANPSASSTPKMVPAGKLLKRLSQSGLSFKTALYGIHPSALPERTLLEENVDFVFCGEPFMTALKLLETLKSDKNKKDYTIKGLWYKKDGKIVSNGWGEVIKNIDGLPFAAWDILPMEKYRAHNWHCFGRINQRNYYAVIYTSLGCPYNCSYCNIHALYGGQPGIRYRSINKVMEEIDLLVKKYKIKNLKILDELFVVGENRVVEMCDLLIQRGYDLNIWAYARVDTVNEKILKKLKQAGVRWLCFGIESADKKVRDGVTKGRFDLEIINRAINLTHEAGINVIGNFMFGLPDENMQTMQETLQLAKQLDCEYVNFYTTMAYPGSQLYKDALNAGAALPKEWSGYSQFNANVLPLPTKYLSAAQVLKFRDSAFEAYFGDFEYQNMIRDKFGKDTAEHVKELLKCKMQRNLLQKC